MFVGESGIHAIVFNVVEKSDDRGGVMYNVGAVRLCPKGDPKGLGCSTPKGSERSITW